METKGEEDVGVPIKLLLECAGHKIKIVSVFGDTFEGLLVAAENTMNCHMSAVTLTKQNKSVSKMDNLYINGSQIKMIYLPDVLQVRLFSPCIIF